MAISKARKEELVADYMALLQESKAVVMAEYQGLSVKDMEHLRSQIRDAGARLHVTKNTLLREALEQSGRTVPDGLLGGQIATGFALEEVPALAKALVEFAKKEDKLVVRGGLLGMDTLTAAQIEDLATLPSLDELRTQLAGLIVAPANNLAATIAATASQLLSLIDAIAQREDADAAPAATDEDAPAAAAEEAPAAEAAPEPEGAAPADEAPADEAPADAGAPEGGASDESPSEDEAADEAE